MSNNTSRRTFLLASGRFAAAAALGSCATALAADSPVPLPKRHLGKTGVEVGILGLGADGLVTDSADPDELAHLFSEALDAGVNFFDTAAMYGKDGQSEKNLGLLMGTKRRREAFLATKTGSRTYDGAMKQVAESLRRLRTDHLDLIQVHHVSAKDDPTSFAAKGGVLTALRKLRDQKVVRFIGLTGHSDAPQVAQALKLYEWDTLMCFVNPAKFADPALREQIPLAQKKGMGIIAMKTFGGRSGLLVGNAPGQAAAASLLRFVWTQPTSVAIPGISSRRQFRENLETARRFQPMTEQEIAALTRQINSGAKPWQR